MIWYPVYTTGFPAHHTGGFYMKKITKGYMEEFPNVSYLLGQLAGSVFMRLAKD